MKAKAHQNVGNIHQNGVNMWSDIWNCFSPIKNYWLLLNLFKILSTSFVVKSEMLTVLVNLRKTFYSVILLYCCFRTYFTFVFSFNKTLFLITAVLNPQNWSGETEWNWRTRKQVNHMNFQENNVFEKRISVSVFIGKGLNT